MKRGPWFAAAILIAIVLTASLLMLRTRQKNPSAPAADRIAAGLSTPVLAESVAAAHARADWMSAIRWGMPLVGRAPRSSGALCDLALAVHNVSLAQATAEYRARPPLRNSLQRIRYDNLAITLMDSARACARNADEWTCAERYLGNFYEILGLPLEALEHYEAILVRAPRDSVALARRYWVATHLLDPRASDFPTFNARVDPLPNRARRSSGR